ncbi:MAG: 3-deoxy-manno-octulosonate cytidylyltransferase [Proteobacteria bacterium]|nr:MAG: 3-deoxy-manno-octulosonate cytidylyltransferase [Pseudomonadota bacterium]
MKVAVVIPTRMAASRFPGKPLTPIMGIPMVEHVYRRCSLAVPTESIFIATCDREIYELGRSWGANVIMTSDQHVRCTDRVAEAMKNFDGDVVVNVQGDEPVLDPDCIKQVLSAFGKDAKCLASNLIQKMNVTDDDPGNYNTVKVVFNQKLEALYLSREPIPTPKKSDAEPRHYYKQTGIMAFNRQFLQTFTHLPPTPLEKIESVDMLRLIEHGFKLQFVDSPSKFYSVDIPSDVKKVEEALLADVHFQLYRR